ncbi:tRNA wybutosine-synthesizing protein 2 homolog isoform X2 [Limulus polyphemus]|uniref:tRNA(Phe) (4-demethylwyosine(37)-C(7)) aminocarboxypropyltransferase n=1 Tax=Limulus polyphemus TaxID=6850 RepID=A0ABM1RVN6_LIMPO|nr:tRNA wybutosine-synthesizing protein 2 homolog isoform X2 [Limulus polyphemus]
MEKKLLVAVCLAKDAQNLRETLQSCGIYDSARKARRLDDKIALPLTRLGCETNEEGCTKIVKPPDIPLPIDLNTSCALNGVLFTIQKSHTEPSPRTKSISLQEDLFEKLKLLMERKGVWSSSLLASIPKHWERHDDMVLLPSSCFTEPVWQTCVPEVWNVVAETLRCRRLAKKNRIQKNDFRTPNVELLKGENGWVVHKDNGIKYTYDVRKCMFSAGNISEKLRVAKFHCSGETVVDLYAGIGYFTLPYLIHANAKCVHACEWNNEAVEALRKNLVLNKVTDKCVIHIGDNREVCPRGVADRVNLGLLPSSEPGWKTACLALKRETGGILHVHANVNSKQTSVNGSSVVPGQNDLGDDSFVTEPVEVFSHSIGDSRKENGSDDTPNKPLLMTSRQFNHSTWYQWASRVSEHFKDLFLKLYSEEWTICVLHVEHLKCKPSPHQST